MAIKNVIVDGKNFDLSYELINPTKKEDILFLHGWGSNKDIMKRSFSSYLQDYRHIYLDMSGFGKSPNNYVLTTNDYSKITKEFLKSINSNCEVIFGHSFGGKVATLLNPKNLVLLSSAGILEEKPIKVKIKIFFAKLLNKLGLKNFTKVFRSKDVDKMSENMYATFKNVVDEDFSSYFSAKNLCRMINSLALKIYLVFLQLHKQILFHSQPLEILSIRNNFLFQ